MGVKCFVFIFEIKTYYDNTNLKGTNKREEHLSFTFDAPFTNQSFILYYCLCQKLRNERKCNVKCKEVLHKISDGPG